MSFVFYFPVLSFPSLYAQVNNGVDRPKLVVGIVVDQMRWDYLYRYMDKYSEGGFKRLLKNGHSFQNTMIPYTPTVTAAGHSSLYTGSVPSIHGIVNNDWVESETGKRMYCSQDTSVQTVGSYSLLGKMSPKNLLTTTIGDELRLATNFRSRVYGIAFKDRGGILPAGHSANAAYWFDDSTGNWISSTYYMNALPQWLQELNAKKLPDAYAKSGWNLLYNANQYDQSAADNSKHKREIDGLSSNTFPHTYDTKNGKNYFALRYAPFGNDFTTELATQLILNEKLGMSGQTDMLCLSYSSTDYLAHTFGPQAIETEDTYLRLDLLLENFLKMLDKNIGKNEYVIFLSADHGSHYSAGYMQEKHMPGGSLRGLTLFASLNAYLLSKYKVKDIFQNYFEYQFFLNRNKLTGLNEDEVRKDAVNFLTKQNEVLFAFDYKHINESFIPPAFREKLLNGYYPKRSGDIQFILKSQFTEGLATGTDHGTPYTYDTHIPLIFYGWGINPGVTYRETYMTDAAPTLCSLLHIQMPGGCVGHTLPEAIKLNN